MSKPSASSLGGLWVVISGVISRATIIMTLIRGLLSLLITTHEPASRASCACWPLLEPTTVDVGFIGLGFCAWVGSSKHSGCR